MHLEHKIEPLWFSGLRFFLLLLLSNCLDYFLIFSRSLSHCLFLHYEDTKTKEEYWTSLLFNNQASQASAEFSQLRYSDL